ncbi:bifunctional D-glycero-beta-D-manno-heptose-7-phosphate kinase/D-glycero-beta-D-manno-heptose 1-phosphate adenylyltransferase HldE [Citrifermentans bremense]|uniref:bifunctional D-glycero-beta-D-manno-heptose-7-phosphate kinase/D-glycero-beta-D-manno-heptose 1-phosphate adenylyltransferase HldE n=1 Tax=Citrifermentans bremense TaxID=60035 RepID=UPI00041770E1|nr:bifunctional D-glycero-beta-D-manno-heptose-7-phosphate kinase/D-glycero-beta-D-manno-heptose 1-phosphate adenylyltransferase HldE [Citrifermentans bremense]
MERREVESFFERAASIRALVVGDLMLDEYLWGRAERISPEAPVQVVEVAREDLRLGGAGNVVNNLAALGCQVSVCSVIGSDENGALLRRALEEKGAGLEGLFEEGERRTSKKTRVLAANQQIVRIDRETKSSIAAASEQGIIDYLAARSGDFDVIVVSDYLKGVLTPAVLSAVCRSGRELGIPVVVDPKGNDYGKYRGATILTPNRKEAEIASGVAITDQESLQCAASGLLSCLELDALLITRSEAGMSLFPAAGGAVHIPTVAREVFDVTGAGDTVISVLSLGLACGLAMADAAWIANVAAGIAVGKLGTSTVAPQEIVAEVGHGAKDSDSKIKNLDVLAHAIAREHSRGKKVVFTNGCFDLLHVGHVKYLQKARGLGDILVVGLNTDASVRRLKGEKRPLIEETERAHILAALDCIDYVVLFDEDTPLKVIETLAPDILVKGGDYSIEGVVGREVVEARGGRVELIQFVDGRSTSRIIEKILSSY